jgi:outer membrane lipoprotein SlyB
MVGLTMHRILALTCLLALASGCAAPTSRMGVFPMRSQDLTQQGNDTIECRDIAQGIAGSMGAETATGAAVGVGAGAVVGAALGAIAGAFFGAAGTGAAFGAALGGATGGLRGAASGAGQNQTITAANYAACMRARGYEVAR